MAKNKNIFFGWILLLILISISLAYSQGYNETLMALNQSRIDVQEMIEAGFSIARANDTLSQAEQLFDAQTALQKAGGNPDFSLILERAAEVMEIRKKAEEMGDQLKALETRLKETGNQSEAYSIFAKAKQEFVDERYDKVAEFIEESYTKISEEQALQTRFRAIYVASTKTIADFFKKRLKPMVFTIVFVSLLYFVLHKRVAIFLVDRKISKLNLEKGVLGKLTKKSQYEYFHLFKIPEELYHIRITKYGELIRDIDRQIPLLVEEKEKLKGIVKEEKEESKAEKFKKLYKIILVSVATVLLFLVAAGIFMIVYLKISYSQILEFTNNIPLRIDENLISMVNRFGSTKLIIIGIVIILFISFMYIYLRKRRKKSQEKVEEEPKGIMQLKLQFSNQIDKLKLQYERFLRKIEETREYRRLLKQKRKEEMPNIWYLRKQKLILFMRNLKEKLGLIKPKIKAKIKVQKEVKVKKKKPKT